MTGQLSHHFTSDALSVNVFQCLPATSSGFSTSVNFFSSAITISSVQIFTFRKIFLFLCHTETYNAYLTKQLNVTIKT